MAKGKQGKQLSEKSRQIAVLPKSKIKTKKSKNKKAEPETRRPKIKNNKNSNLLQGASPQQQLTFFLDQYQSANHIQLSSLEVEAIKDTCILELPQSLAQDDSGLVEGIKAAFGPSWKEVLCEKELKGGKNEPGNPAVLVVSLSALRSLELLRQLRPLARECPAAKLFSKHMKVDDQVSILKNRVNIASGTPNRIKKLIDVEALGLSRLSVVVLDMHTDVKGYSLLTLPQVRDEFWDMYKSCFHQRLLEGDIRLCLCALPPAMTQ
ncbi:hypothetical protein LguiA_031511 [Lonicera macranthoides]